MRCTNCGKRVPDAPYCQLCGYHMGVAKPPRQHKKRANGQGSVVKMAHLRKPYRAFWHNKYLGDFATVAEAEEAIVHAKGDLHLDLRTYTMQDVYTACTGDRAWQQLTDRYQRDTESAWRYMAELHTVKARSITHEQLQAVLYRAADEGKSRSHQHKLRVLLRRLCQWCRQHGLHERDYAEGLVVSGDAGEPRNPFDDAALAILYRHREDRVAGILWILCCTGWRFADLAKIRRDDRIDLDGHSLRLEGSKTKAGRERYSVLDPVTWQVFLRFYLATPPGEYIFRSPAGAQWDYHHFRRREFYPCLAQLGIQPLPRPGERPRYTPYSCRHTFATLSDRSGVDRAVLQQVMGHVVGSTVTDDHYIHDHEQQAAAEFVKLGRLIQQIIS